MKTTLAAAALASALLSAFSLHARADETPDETPKAWIDTRLTEEERAILADVVGFAPPAIPETTRFVGEEWSFDAYRGKVVVIQSWSRMSQSGRAAISRLDYLIHEFTKSGDAVLIGLHTPEGADAAATYIERKKQPCPTLIDTSGHFCDDLGIYVTPTSVVIGKDGAIRYAGLRYSGVRDAVKQLLEEPFDEKSPAPQPVTPRDQRDGAPSTSEEPAPGATGDYPAITGTLSGARDLRGKRAPRVQVASWLNGEPDLEGKVVIVDFWATWCGPCRASIPHMNDLASEFKGAAVVVGLSDENESTVRNFMRRTKMDYSVAIDPERRMTSAVQNRGIPHGLVISPDGIVRWQGHPATLDEDTLRRIVNASGAGGGAGGSTSQYRWVRK